MNAMTRKRIGPAASASIVIVLGLTLTVMTATANAGTTDDGLDDPAKPSSAAKPRSEGRSSVSKGKSRKPASGKNDSPPPCRSPLHAAAHSQRPMNRPAPAPARSMPDLFARMGEGFMRNPAGGFANWLEELSRLEEPALQGVRLSIAEEKEAGRQARAEYLKRAAARGYQVVDDPKRLEYLEALIAKAAKRMKNRDRYSTIDVTLIDAPIPDGQSFPGGYLAFTTALLKEPDEATVFGVVAHELAHLDRGHQYQYARRGKLAESHSQFRPGGFGFGNPADFQNMFTKQAAILGLILRPHRPEHEHDADCWAVDAMYLNGYDPLALADFLERIHQRLRDTPVNPVFDFGRSHPYSLERKQAVVDRLKQLRKWRDRGDLGRFPENLQTLQPRN